MIRAIGNTTAAELVKLRGLRSVLAAVVATVGAAIAMTAAVAASTTDAERITTITIPYLQIGPILVGVLAVATEYQGSQVRVTLTATPNRLLLLTGKTLAYLATAAITSAATVGGGLGAAAITLAARDSTPAGSLTGWPVAGAGVYLTLIGLLGYAVTVLLRSLIAPLVTMLSLVLIASPLLDGYTERARWLPDRAGSLLYLPGNDAVLTPGTGALVLLGWIAATASAALATFLIRDAT